MVDTKIYVGPSKRNTLRPWENVVELLKLDLVRVSLSLFFFSIPCEVTSSFLYLKTEQLQ
jgi:hypothetical protein